MTEETRLGLFASLCIVAVGSVIALLHGPIWYAVGPALVFAAYFVKARVRGLRDKPSVVMTILAAVSLAMIGFAVR